MAGKMGTQTAEAVANPPRLEVSPNVPRLEASPFCPKHEHTIVVLQGGAALGAYQAGVYAGLEKVGVAVDWIAGPSTGATNAALIAGNPPGRRIERLREFRDRMSANFPLSLPSMPAHEGNVEAMSFYNTQPLKATLEEWVDLDFINSKQVRLSLGAGNVRTGNSQYFDSAENSRWCISSTVTTHIRRISRMPGSRALRIAHLRCKPLNVEALNMSTSRFRSGSVWVIPADKRLMITSYTLKRIGIALP